MSYKKIPGLTLSSSFDKIKQINPYLNELKSRFEIDEALFSNIQLAVNEAVTNAIIHGNDEDASKNVTVNGQISADKIEIMVEDEGSGFDPSALPDPRSEEQLLKQGGRGVFLIKQYADEISFEKNGRLVRMTFDL